MNGSGDLAEPYLRPLGDDGNILYTQRRAALGHNDRVFDIAHISDQAHFPDIDLLQTGFDEAAARIGIVVGELLLHLGQAETVGDQFVGINAHLIFAGRATEAGNINHVGDGLEVFLDHPILDCLQFHHVVVRILAFQREEVDLADGAPIRTHLGHDPGRQGHLRKPFEDPLPVPGVLLFIFENQLHIGKPKKRERTQMNHMGDAVHHRLKRNRDLLLDLFRGNSWPLRDDLDIVIGDVGIGFDGELVERDRSPAKQYECRCEDKKAVLQRKINNLANHLLFHRVLQHQRVRGHLLPRPNARDNLLHVSWKHLSGGNFDALKLSIAYRCEDPVTVT